MARIEPDPNAEPVIFSVEVYGPPAWMEAFRQVQREREEHASIHPTIKIELDGLREAAISFRNELRGIAEQYRAGGYARAADISL